MKRIFSILLAAALLLCSAGVSAAALESSRPAPGFQDVPADHWASASVLALTDRKIVTGYPDGSFRPDAQVTRAEWAKLFALSSGIEIIDPMWLHLSTENVNDIDGMTQPWYGIYAVSAMPYFPGYYHNGTDPGDGICYFPQRAATREEVILSIGRFRQYDLSAANLSILESFQDADQIPNASRPYFAIAVATGILQGFGDGTLRPLAPLSRAEAAAILHRVF